MDIGFVVILTFERFAFSGSKPLLALFLATSVAEGGIGLSEVDAAPIAAALTSFTYITPIVGGWICDRFLGARYAVTLGCILMGIGYLLGWQSHSVGMVWAMIVVVAIGTAFFKGNLAAIIGRLFDDEKLLDTAFSIQYSFVNIGAFFGSMIGAALYMSTFKEGDVLGSDRYSFFVQSLSSLVVLSLQHAMDCYRDRVNYLSNILQIHREMLSVRKNTKRKKNLLLHLQHYRRKMYWLFF